MSDDDRRFDEIPVSRAVARVEGKSCIDGMFAFVPGQVVGGLVADYGSILRRVDAVAYLDVAVVDSELRAAQSEAVRAIGGGRDQAPVADVLIVEEQLVDERRPD